MIDQLTVFLENSAGRLAKLCRAISDAGVNMKALTIADTTEYGVVRIVCDNPAQAKAALDEKGYRAMVTKVAAIEVSDKAGSLADLLAILDNLDINVEYGYCFSMREDSAVDILKLSTPGDTAKVVSALAGAGFRVLEQKDL